MKFGLEMKLKYKLMMEERSGAAIQEPVGGKGSKLTIDKVINQGANLQAWQATPKWKERQARESVGEPEETE